MEDYVHGAFDYPCVERDIANWLHERHATKYLDLPQSAEALETQNQPDFEQHLMEHCRMTMQYIKVWSETHEVKYEWTLAYWNEVSEVLEIGPDIPLIESHT